MTSEPSRRALHERRDGRKLVVVLGAGFAGLHVVRGLARESIDIVLIDRRNHHVFQPLLYQVATATLNPSDIARPIRSIFRRQKNVRTLLADAQSIDVAARRVELDRGFVDYDWLVVATGATHSYFGNDEWQQYAPGLKTIEDALEMRRRVLAAYEAAELDAAASASWLRFVVIGAGPTGVELAGALAEISRQSLRHEFRAIDSANANVILLERGPRVLPPYPEKLSASAQRQLESLGVEVRTGAKVVDVDETGVRLADGEFLASRTVLWAAGVEAAPIAQSLGADLDASGRVKVEADLSLEGHAEVFVLGDLAHVKLGEDAHVPGVAPAAIQAGKHCAKQIRADLRGEARVPFRYRDKGSLATIGWARAVADLGRFRFGGFLAWLAWMSIHVMFLVGFRNKIFVMLSWAWSYLTFRRGARLITGRETGGSARSGGAR